jgi:preprotein translocase subunit SecG
MIVLLQTGKGADMGAAFGGGSSQTLFGSTGASTFLSKATTGAVIIFMITSLGLAYISSHRIGDSVMIEQKIPVEQETAPVLPVEQETAPAAPVKKQSAHAVPEKNVHSDAENTESAKPAE